MVFETHSNRLYTTEDVTRRLRSGQRDNASTIQDQSCVPLCERDGSGHIQHAGTTNRLSDPNQAEESALGALALPILV